MLSCCPSDVFKNPNSSLSTLLLGALPTDIGVQALAVLGCALLQQYNKLKETHIHQWEFAGQEAKVLPSYRLFDNEDKWVDHKEEITHLR